jgi:hypothetical protein
VDTFLDNARRIFDVARSDSSAEASDFALLVREDGSLHLFMESALVADSAPSPNYHAVYRVSRSATAVSVSGQSGGNRIELTNRRESTNRLLLPDRPLYMLSEPALPCAR